jgi:hypothetical protein
VRVTTATSWGCHPFSDRRSRPTASYTGVVAEAERVEIIGRLHGERHPRGHHEQVAGGDLEPLLADGDGRDAGEYLPHRGPERTDRTGGGTRTVAVHLRADQVQGVAAVRRVGGPDHPLIFIHTLADQSGP